MENITFERIHPLLSEMNGKSDVEKQNSFQYYLQTVHKCLRIWVCWRSSWNRSSACCPNSTELNVENHLKMSCTITHYSFATLLLHILELNVTEKKGDLNRAVLNSKYSIPFFLHSLLYKFLVENIVFKTEYLLSQLQRIRV